jgi:hypothetical protein
MELTCLFLLNLKILCIFEFSSTRAIDWYAICRVWVHLEIGGLLVTPIPDRYNIIAVM